MRGFNDAHGKRIQWLKFTKQGSGEADSDQPQLDCGHGHTLAQQNDDTF